jgi:hypothetical protein
MGRVSTVDAPRCGEIKPVARVVEDVERSAETGQETAGCCLQHSVGVLVAHCTLQHIRHREQMLDLVAIPHGLGHGSSPCPGLVDHAAEGQEQRGQDRDAADDLERQKELVEHSEIIFRPVRLACLDRQELGRDLPQHVHGRLGPVQASDLLGPAGAAGSRCVDHLRELRAEMGNERRNRLGARRAAGRCSHEPVEFV